MPSVGETTIGDDIERIRMIRNSMFGHISSASTSQTEFDDTWSVITDICQRLQTYTKKDYVAGLNNIQSQALEEEYETTVIEKLREDYKNNQSLMEKLFSVEKDLQELKRKSEDKENTLVKEFLDNWQKDDIAFIPTRACEVVEEKFKSLNLITVVGNSGTGKSAIIQHIALKYKEQGWNVIPVEKVKEIKKNCSTRVSENRILFVFNDPLGKESLDEILYHSWKSLEKTLEICLKKKKLLISCRRCVFYDKRVKGNLLDESTAVEIDSEENGLTVKEKKAILNQYAQNLKLSEEVVTEIVKTEAYFPLLCKLFSREAKYKEKGVDFFKNPYRFIKKELEFGQDKKRFCSLILIVAFKKNLKIDTILKSDISLMKFKDILGMCEIQENTHISVIRSTLHELKGSYVKCIGHVFQFLHDFIMEITTLVFGVDCPQETIQYADSSFLRRRVKIEDDTEEENRDPFSVYLPVEYIDDLVDRFITDIQTKHIIDVLLNPCLRKESLINSCKEKMNSLEKLLVKIKCEKDRSKFQTLFERSFFTRIDFLYSFESEICPLVGLIVFYHSDISSFYIKSIPETKLKEHHIFSAICANGDLNLLNSLSEEYKKAAMMERWDDLFPIHIASVFHNFSIIEELIRLGADVNKLTTSDICTPLFLAAANDEDHIKEAGIDIKTGERRNNRIICLLNNGDKAYLCENENVDRTLCMTCYRGRDITVQLLLDNGADIKLCDNDGCSPLCIVCLKGHDSTVQLLLDNSADINLCVDDGISPLYIACLNGHDSTVQLLLNNGADINLCKKNGTSPLIRACQNGHDSTVQLLLNNGADINICINDGASPLYIACYDGHDSTVQLLLNNGANINLCDKDGVSPLYIACEKGHDSTVQLLLNNGTDINLCQKNGASPLHVACENRHDSTVQLLVNNGADINLRKSDGASPLYIACQNGHESTLQLLLNNGADINLCNKNGFSPLHRACLKGHDSTVQLLLNNGADIKLCNKNGVSPLYIACLKGHDSSVQLLLNNGADINFCDSDGDSPLDIACHQGHNSTVQLLLNNGADINLCKKNGTSPLYIACQNAHDSMSQLLLNNGADINLCEKNGISPLYIACYDGHDYTVQVLLNNGANINLCKKNGASPLYIACQNGHDSTVQLLQNNGADINLGKSDGASPLYIACQNGHDSKVQLLLNNGADINLCEKNGTSPFYIACQNGHDSTVQLLLNNGADINLCEKNGTSPLYIACQNKYDNTVQLVLNNGADINLCEKNGTSPLYIACQNEHDSTVQLLLNNGADINLCEKNGTSPLYIACQNGHDSTVQLLLNNGADINLCEKNGGSPLYIACQNGHDNTVQLLLNNGADINLCDNDGFSPLYITCEKGHDSIVQLLLNNGANINSCDEDEFSPLHIACQNKHDRTVQLLLNSGADINLYSKSDLDLS
ncbi:LOW QUALITY PROTEIN: ankyrin-1-like [Saccostrea cucullata]|uniref:LOW QUALITY PROTEIN: ankyrin-1-like n=1 Tax=Saccostrea cuccullata TaxID=36930 RepID=UPI002ED45E7A